MSAWPERKQPTPPLLEIQRCEAEVASLVAAAENAATLRVSEVRKQIGTMKQNAADAGRADGKAANERILAEARIQADKILEDAQEQADDLWLNREQHVERMVEYALGIILELDKETGVA